MSTPLTDLEIFEAASQVFVNGKEPTNALVRKQLGRGSYSVIAPALKRWKKENKSNEHENIVAVMPDELKLLGVQTGNNIAKTIWVEALNYAEDKVKLEMFADLENEIEQLKEERMHYKDVEIELRTIKEFQSNFSQMFEDKDKKQKESDKKIEQLEQTVANLLEQQFQNK